LSAKSSVGDLAVASVTFLKKNDNAIFNSVMQKMHEMIL